MTILFNTLPTELQNSIKDALNVYGSTKVYKKKNGTMYNTNTVSVHTGEYDEFLVEFEESGVFTEDEMMINYVETFKDYPTNYTGTKNYKALHGAWTKAKLVNGNIELV